MKYGWRFKIPVQGRSGNGYIFSDEYTDTDEAHKELEKDLGHKIKIIKDLKFDPGRLENVWIKNCVAVGLSANFVEPLEATSIGTSIQQAYLLMHNIVNVDESVITRYNKQVITIMDNVRDFVFLHYLCGKKDTKFWRDVNKIKPPLSLDNNLKLWKNRLPINDDIDGTVYKLFWASNFSQILYGLNYFDIKKIKNQFNSYSAITQTKLNWYFNDELHRLTKISEKVLHKNEIELIKMADPELHEKNKTH